MKNPNESKYFDEKYGCTLNAKCKVCEKSIYVPNRIMTVYHGKEVRHNREDKIMSVYHMELGPLCPDCFKENK